VPFETQALNLLARAAEGSMRDALSLLDQAIAHGAGKVEETSVREMLGAVDRSYLFSLLKALASGQGPALLAEAERMAARSLSFDAALQELATLLHRVALAQTLPEALADDEPERDALLGLAGAFSEEDVQLLYQIAIHGRRDLAFLPVEPGKSASADTPSAVRPASKPAAAAGPTAALEATVKGAASAEQELADWRTLVGRIKVGGMARMLADNCEFRSLDGDRLELAVPEAHKHLLEKVYTDKLQAALADYFGRKLRLRISTGGTGNTPAEIENQERQAKLAKAIESIDTDPFVRDLVENFDARVKDSSIKPIQ
jgi:DNA polymerase-3 subunit gamma/tau